GLASLPDTSLRTPRPDVVRDDEEQAKLLCHSGFRETSRNFTYLCWVLPKVDDGCAGPLRSASSSQQAPKCLAGRAARNGVDELDLSRHLERGERWAEIADDLVGGPGVTGVERDERLHHLAKVRVGNAHDDRIGNRDVLVQQFLYVARVDLLATDI